MSASSPWVWLGALLAYDFLYYWLHRAGHTVALFWAAHVVHHQSVEYNLSTALRQTGSGWLAGWLFYLPMAIVGVPPLVFAVVALIDLLYQFWVRTRQIDRSRAGSTAGSARRPTIACTTRSTTSIWIATTAAS